MKELADCLDILIMTPFYLGYIWAACRFCRRFLGRSHMKGLPFLFFSLGGWLFLSIADRYSPVFLGAAEHALFTGLVLLFFEEIWEKKILAAAVLMLTGSLVETFSGSFISCIVLTFKHTVRKIPVPLIDGWESSLIGCAGLCLAIFAINWTAGRFSTVFWGKPGKWYAVLAVPLLAVIVMHDAALWGASNGVMVRSGGGMSLYHDQIFSHVGFCVLAALSMAAAGFYVFGMNRIYLEQEKNSRYHSQIAVYKMLAEEYRQTEGLRHDMKNHVIALSALFQDREWDKLGEYLKNMEGIALAACGDVTGNKAVDALLYRKRKRAEEENIRWECDVQIPKGDPVNAFDLCVLFGNILDNALEACGRMQSSQSRFIHIRAKAVKKCFLIEVKNSMDRTEKQGEGFTGQEDTWEYGVGLRNVEDVVQSYNGAAHMDAENGVFTISILIPFADAAYDTKTVV